MAAGKLTCEHALSLLGIVSVLGLALLCAGCSSSQAAFRPTAKKSECPGDVEVALTAPHSCGYLTVLEDRSRAGGGTIKLFYLRVHPRGGRGEPTPIGSVGYELAQSPDYGSIVGIAESSNRELILLDQRGTGHSRPSLGCPEVDDVASQLTAVRLSPSGRNLFTDAVSACRRRLTDAGAHLGAYSLAAAGEDLEDLRRALGVASWNLISWGTSSRVLLEYARRHARHVRALVLGSPQFPQRDPISEAEGDLNAALGALAKDCRVSEPCRSRYPDVERALAEATGARERSPVSTSVQGTDVVVDGAALVRAVRHVLSSEDREARALVPRMVYDALTGRVRAVASVLASDPGMCVGYLPRCDQPRSLGAYLSFTCADAPTSLPEASVRSIAFGSADPYAAACRAWGMRARGSARAAVPSGVPMLVLRGEYDAYSPLDLVREAAATTRGPRVVFVPHLGHDVFADSECLREARNRWLLNPRTATDFSACFRTIDPPRFR